MRLARDTGQLSQLSNALCALGWVEAGRGDAKAAAAHLNEALHIIDEMGGRSPFAFYVHAALGFASLTEERYDAAVESLQRAQGIFDHARRRRARGAPLRVRPRRGARPHRPARGRRSSPSSSSRARRTRRGARGRTR